MSNFSISQQGNIIADGALLAVDVREGANGLALLLSGAFSANVQIAISFNGVDFVNHGAVKAAAGHFPIVPCHSVRLTVDTFVAAFAVGTLTGTANFADGETVTIGTKVYTFEDELTDVDGNVHVGADLEASCDNLRAAVNLDATAGTDYALSMTEHPDVSATDTATTVVATAKVAGVGGNAIDTTEGGANASWGAITLEGGTFLAEIPWQLGGLTKV